MNNSISHPDEENLDKLDDNERLGLMADLVYIILNGPRGDFETMNEILRESIELDPEVVSFLLDF